MYTVLIVEDEILVSVGLRNMIDWSDVNMQVIGEAQNGKQGLQMYYEYKPDIILTDLKMPVMDGMEMIEQIRRHDTTTKIIVLSCHEEFELVRQAFKMGISEYILKVEILPEELKKILQRVQHDLEKESVKDKTQTEEARMET